MNPSELAGHARKKVLQFVDGTRERDWTSVPLESSGVFPRLPCAQNAPAALRQELQHHAECILRGHWRAFGHLDLKVDDPPKWHCDYLAGKDLATTASAFRLNHRKLPGGADIKLIWELSRWHPLVRLAMAAYVLDDERAAEKCLVWLEDWIKHNPPFRGWNWTSALEGGLRLLQFTWIDALLSGKTERWGFDGELDTLRHEILPPHAWFTWRHKSFGSSANNHLFGELAGLIVATARWPALAQWGVSLDELQRPWAREVLAQFAEDGGNNEQALNYQLFSWEFCWQARTALAAAGRTIPAEVDERLRRAAQFFVDVQVPEEPWDYGDSDNAFLSPLFADETRCVAEWHEWFRDPEQSAAIEYWLGETRRTAGVERWADVPLPARPSDGQASRAMSAADKRPDDANEHTGWQCYAQSGYVLYRRNGWTLRWDLSPLGYLKTAAHGHLDALHLSVWVGGVAMIVDPGTGCYYADRQLRAWLASRPAHNAPHPDGPDHPRRLGPFLWGPHQDSLLWSAGDESRTPEELREWFEKATGTPMPFRPKTPLSRSGGIALLQAGNVLIQRLLTVPGPDRIEVEDACWRPGRASEHPFSVRWQFAPGAALTRLDNGRFRVTRRGVSMNVEPGVDWTEIVPVMERSSLPLPNSATTDLESALAGTVSPAFRKVEWAPFLKLVARPKESRPESFRTVFSIGE